MPSSTTVTIPTRCKVCRKKNTMQEKRMDNQTAMMCSNCLWLDPESIKDVEGVDKSKC